MCRLMGFALGLAPKCAVAALTLVLFLDRVRAGSIFDDDWTPAAPAKTSPPATPAPGNPSPAPFPAIPADAAPATKPAQPADIKPSPPAAPDSTTPPDTAEPARLRGIPTPQEQAKLRTLFKQVYSQQLMDHTANGLRALAIQLLADAAKATDAPVDRFVMLSGARQAAVEAADVASALSADDELRESFLVDKQLSRLDLLTRLSKTVRTPPASGQLVKACLTESDAAAKDRRYDSAAKFAEAAVAAAKLSGNAALLARANARAARAQAVNSAYVQLAEPLATLKKTPNDPGANLTIGRFYCLTVGDWLTGLPFLAAGSDAPLKAAAKADLAGGDGVSIAQQWQSLAEQAGSAEKHNLRLRAATWYREALKTLEGLARIAVESKLMALSSGPFRADAIELSLSNTQPSDEVLANGTGLAALGSIRGHFQGGGEKAGIVLAEDGTWSSESESHQGKLDYSVITYAQSDGLDLNAAVKEYQWQRGEPKVKMIARSEGFCFLSYVAGHFAGAGETARVTIGADGYWYLDCATGQELWVRAVSVKPRRPQLFSTEIREVTWKRGSPPMRLIREDEGMCFLTMIHGGMLDAGDTAGLHLGDDGFWTLQGTGHILEASAIVIHYLPDARRE